MAIMASAQPSAPSSTTPTAEAAEGAALRLDVLPSPGGWFQLRDPASRRCASSVAAVELDLGRPLFEPGAAATTLTAAGRQRLVSAREELAALGDEPEEAPKSGGKAKASKGTGRAPVVKGQPKPYKRRQSR